MEKDKNGVNLLPSWIEIDLAAMFTGKKQASLEQELQEADEELRKFFAKGDNCQKKKQDSIQPEK